MQYPLNPEVKEGIKPVTEVFLKQGIIVITRSNTSIFLIQKWW